MTLPTEITSAVLLALLVPVLALLVKDYISSRKWKAAEIQTLAGANLEEIQKRDETIAKKDEQIIQALNDSREMALRFQETVSQFSVVLSNHMNTQESCTKEMINCVKMISDNQVKVEDAITRLCVMWENGK